MSEDLRIDPQFPVCGFCEDTGLIHLPKYPPCYRWCACPAGVERRASEPQLVDESNQRETALGGGC